MYRLILLPKQCVLPIFLSALFVACNVEKGEPASDCQPPTMIVAQAPCESNYPGAYLTASGFAGNGSLLFEIYPQKDTVSNDLNVKRWTNGSSQRERIVITDAVLGNAPKFLVRTTINCSGTDRKSKYFAFVKRPVANSPCFVWAQQAN